MSVTLISDDVARLQLPGRRRRRRVPLGHRLRRLLRPDERAAAQRSTSSRAPAARPAAVMFFALEPALDALPSSASAASARSRRCCRARSRCCSPTAPSASTRLPDRPATLGLRVPRCSTLQALARSRCMQSSANLSGRARRAHARARCPQHPRRRRPRARWRRAAGHAVHGRRLRGYDARRWQVLREARCQADADAHAAACAKSPRSACLAILLAS